jgi:nucleotide-binding universal stress UspA family protein
MKILIAYDGSEFAEAILDDLRCAGLPARAEVAVISMAEPECYSIGKRREEVVGWLDCNLTAASMSARPVRDCIQVNFPGWDVTFETRLASPAREIVRKVAQWNPDLAIIGQRGRRGSGRSGLGRVAKRLLKDTNCSLRIARARMSPCGAPPRVIIPLAASQNIEALARVVTSRLWPPETEVKLIAFIGPILSEMQLACGIIDRQVRAVMDVLRPVERKLQAANLLVTSEITAGFSAADVIEVARRWGADCVFIGGEERSFLEKVFCGDFVASVASRIVCSVEVVRRPVRRGAVSPEFPAGADHKDPIPAVS